MGIVVETISRSGAIVSTEVFSQDAVVIGRGFDCQVVLHDPHVDAQHITIRCDPQTGALRCADQRTLNGTWAVKLDKKGHVHGRLRRIEGQMPFYSGQAFQLGKSYIRVYHSAHHLPPTLPISPWEETAHKLGHAWLWTTLALVLIGMQVWDSFLNLPLLENLTQYVLRGFYVLLGALVYAGVFAFLGKNFKHDPKLSSHFTVAVGALLAVNCVNYFAPYFAYWFRIVDLSGVVSELLVTGIIFVAGYISLALATPLKRSARSMAAAVAPLAVILTLLIGWLAKPDYHPYPNYDKNLVQPDWQFIAAEDSHAFLSRVEDIYEDADRAIESD